MRQSRKISGTLAAVLALAFVLPALAGCATDSMVVRNVVRNQEETARNGEAYLDKNVITVVLPGTAGPMSPFSAQTANAVFVNGQFLLSDAGDYAQKRMEQYNLPMAALDAIFVTHFHNDHIADIGGFAGVPQDVVSHVPQKSDIKPACRLDRDQTREIALPKHLIHQRPHTMHILISDLHEYASAIRE